MILIKNQAQFEKEVLQNVKPTLVDFYATWCGPCKAFAPLLDEMDKDADTYQIAKIDIDELPELAQQYRIASVPTILLFEHGKNTARSVGLKNRRELENLLQTKS